MQGTQELPAVLEGELTIAHARSKKDEIIAALEAGARVLDLGAITQIDGAGLQLLLLVRREADLRGILFERIIPSRAVRMALDMAQIDETLRAVPQLRPGRREVA